MKEEIIYMLGIVAVGFGVNYTLRALPFILFAGRDRKLPAWVERLGNVISPVIIALLIVYSYSGLAWKTLWPYLAGAVTVALQLWKRNPLVSIVAGTILYMCLLTCGCTSVKPLELDARNPSVHFSRHGVYVGDRPVEAEEVPQILSDYGIPHDSVVHIRLDPDVRDLMGARLLMGRLGQAGYTRTVLVTERKAESYTVEKKAKKPSVKAPKIKTKPQPKRIRYKKNNES